MTGGKSGPLEAHFLLEEAVWAGLAGSLPGPVRRLAAAHAAAALAGLCDLDPAEAPPWLRHLMGVACAGSAPSDTVGALRACPVREPGDREATDNEIEALWHGFTLVRGLAAPAAGLMLEDRDSRLDREPKTGLNRYGIGPWPEDGLIAFSSCTANPVSQRGLAAAEAVRRELIAAAGRGTGMLAAQLDRAASELAAGLCAVLRLPAGTGAVLADSGTVACLLATHLARQGAERVRVLLVGAEETGRGVPLAAAGRHPAGRTALGRVVVEGERVAGLGEGLELEAVAIRDPLGLPVSAGALAARLASSLEAAVAEGRRVVLHAVEGSKTGLVAPGLPVLAGLMDRFRDRLSVIVDACQMRCDAAVLGHTLEAGALVLVTGSKFLGGPPFSGLLLVPSRFPRHWAPLPEGLAAYSRLGDWPAAWRSACSVLPATGHTGLLLRWRAALAEAGSALALTADERSRALGEFERAVAGALGADGPFRLVPPGAGSILTFAVRRSDGAGWHDLAGLRRLYQDVLAGRCLIGQPVALSAGSYPAGLRLAADARLLGRLAAGETAAVRRDLHHVVDRLRALLALY